MTALLARGYRIASGRPGTQADGIVVNPPPPVGVAGTIEAVGRFRPATHGSGRRILHFSDGARELAVTYTDAAFAARVYDGVLDRTFSSAGVVPIDGNEHAVALAWDAAGARLYVDGVLVGSSAGASAWVAWIPTTGAIGNYSPQPTNANGTEGTVRDVRVWSRALAVAELAPFRPQLRGDEAGLVAWWPLEVDALERVRRARAGASDRDDFGDGGSLVGRLTRNGKPWFVTSGTWNVAGGTLMQTAAAGGVRVAGWDCGYPDHKVSARCRVTTNFVGLMLRGVDGANYLQVYRVPGSVQVYRYVAGVQTNLAGWTDPVVSSTFAVLAASVVDNVLTVSIDGVVLGTVVLGPSEAILGEGTRVGPFIQATTDAEFDWITVEPVTGGTSGRHGQARTGAGPAVLGASVGLRGLPGPSQVSASYLLRPMISSGAPPAAVQRATDFTIAATILVPPDRRAGSSRQLAVYTVGANLITQAFWLRPDYTTRYLGVGFAVAGVNYFLNSPNDVFEIGKRTRIVVTRYGRYASFFVDGVARGSAGPTAVDAVWGATSQIGLGLTDGFAPLWDGTIERVSLWDSVRDDALAISAGASPTKGLIADWYTPDFDGSKLVDRSPSGALLNGVTGAPVRSLQLLR